MKELIKWKDSDMAEKILYGVKSIQLPSTTADLNNIILNQTWYMALSKLEVQQTSIAIRDFADLPLLRKLQSSLRLSDELYPDDYKFRIMLNVINRETTNVTNILTIENALIQEISGPSFDHEKSDLVEFTINFRHPPIDWPLLELEKDGINISALSGSLIKISISDISQILKNKLLDFTSSMLNKGLSAVANVGKTLLKKIF